MPVSRDTTLDLAQGLVDLYTGLEQRLASSIANEIRRNPDPSELEKLEALRRLRDGSQRMLERLQSDGRYQTYAAVAEAWGRGGQAALAEIAQSDRKPSWWERRGFILKLLARLVGATKRRDKRDRDRLNRDIADIRDALPGVDAINALAKELSDGQAQAHGNILRWQDDVYRATVAEAGLVDVLAGTKTRLQASQATLDRFLAKGVTGFTDSRGRDWELVSYIETAIRTGTARAAVAGHLARLDDAGIDLVIVSNAPAECELCRPWEGKVLSRLGPVGRIEVEHTLTDELITVDVAGTIPEAAAAGLFHPNCRHSLSAYLPGVTKPPTHTADPAGDAAKRRLRAMERHVRSWKRREAGALTDDATAKAKAKVTQWRAAIDAHTTNTKARRKRRRERINTAR